MKEIRRCPITGCFRAKELSRDSFHSPEERDASRKAKALTAVVAAAFAFFLFVHVPMKIAQLNQRLAMQNVEKPTPDLNIKREPLRIEKDWVLMTIPSSSWQIIVEEPKPVEVKKPEAKPQPPKPEVKVKPKPQPKPKVKPVKSAGSAKVVAPQTTGASKTVTQTQIVFDEIITIIERYKRYPDRARSQGLEGRIMLEVNILADGSIGDYQLQKGGHPLLRRATLQAAKHLKGVRTQATQEMKLVIPINYNIQ